ncbi:hypothetical protein HanIR_Chr08g0363451 [Helianthus annuus]|nr:hypothetical protein HanIR_Chr08g0363451 [Helianthus annuus]
MVLNSVLFKVFCRVFVNSLKHVVVCNLNLESMFQTIMLWV